MLDNVGLIHMNGRVYDPGVGRFMSADPIADRLGEAGGFNRYAYVSNRPLSLTDPSGFSGNNQCKIAGCKPEDAPMMAEITSSSSAKTFNHPNWQMIDIASRIADAFTNVQVVSDSEGTEVEVRGRRSEHDADAARRWLEDLRRRVSTAGWYVREYRCVAVEWGSSTAAGAAGGAAFAFVTGNIPAIAQATLIGGAVGFAASATPSGAGDFFAGMLGSMAVRARSGYSRGDQFAEIIGDGVGALASGPLATIGVGSGIGASLAAVRPVQNLPPLTGAMPAYARMLPGALAGSASATVALAVMALGDSVAERLGCP
jgi:RHS repeat-associated protein